MGAPQHQGVGGGTAAHALHLPTLAGGGVPILVLVVAPQKLIDGREGLNFAAPQELLHRCEGLHLLPLHAVLQLHLLHHAEPGQELRHALGFGEGVVLLEAAHHRRYLLGLGVGQDEGAAGGGVAEVDEPVVGGRRHQDEHQGAAARQHLQADGHGVGGGGAVEE